MAPNKKPKAISDSDEPDREQNENNDEPMQDPPASSPQQQAAASTGGAGEDTPPPSPARDGKDKDDEEDDDEDDDDEDVVGVKRRRQKTDEEEEEDLELDDDDYELLGENLGVKQNRKAQKKRKLKRGGGGGEKDDKAVAAAIAAAASLGKGKQKAVAAAAAAAQADDDDDDDDEDDDGIQPADATEPSRGPLTDAERVARAIGFEGDEAAAAAGEKDQGDDDADDDDDDESDSEDEMADFIVDDPEVDENGKLVEQDEAALRRKRKKKKRRPTDTFGTHMSAAALEDMASIFGNPDELLEQYEMNKSVRERVTKGAAAGAGEAEEDDDLGADEDEAGGAMTPAERAARRKQKQLALVDPSFVEKNYLTEADTAITAADFPERYSLQWGLSSSDPRARVPSAQDFEAEARWIQRRAFSPSARPHPAREVLWGGCMETEVEGNRALAIYGNGKIRRSPEEIQNWHGDEAHQQGIVEALKNMLLLLHDRYLEIPFIAGWRKENLKGLLAIRRGDEPRNVADEEGNAVNDEEWDKRKKEAAMRGEVLPDRRMGQIMPADRRVHRHDVLWAAADLDIAWSAVRKRREKMHAKCATYLADTALLPKDSVERKTVENLQQMLDVSMPQSRARTHAYEDVDSDEVLGDIDAELQALIVRAQALYGGGSGMKVPRKLSRYSACLKAGLGKLASLIGMETAQLAECLETGLPAHKVKDIDLDPEQMAESFLAKAASMGFKTAAEALEGAANIAAVEMASSVSIRRYLRNIYRQYASATTVPTLRGLRELDPFHKYGKAKRITEKPCLENIQPMGQGPGKLAFEGDEFLRCTLAAQEKFVRLDISMNEREQDRFIFAEVERFYQGQREMEGNEGMAWREQRKRVVRSMYDTVSQIFSSEVRQQLLSESRAHVLDEYASEVWRLATTANWRPPEDDKKGDDDDDDDEEESSSLPTRYPVMAGIWGEGNDRQGTPPTCFIMLDRGGQLVDVLQCGRLSGRMPRMKPVEQGVEQIPQGILPDMQRLEKFITEHQPRAIFLGGGAVEARELEEYVNEAVARAVMNSDALRDLSDGIAVKTADESVARLWAASEAATKEIGDHATHVRACVGLGRWALDPLCVLCAVCSSGARSEMLSLKLHPLQDAMTPDSLWQCIERTLMTVVNQVGVDINAAAQHDWRAPPLNFVCGLGVRKASSLMRSLRQSKGFVHQRVDLMRHINAAGMEADGPEAMRRVHVFINCAASLRVRPQSLNMMSIQMEDHEGEPKKFFKLDDTRVHPETYELAQEMAQNVQEGDLLPAVAVARTLKNPEGLADLDLEAYDDHLLSMGKYPGRKLSTLVDTLLEYLAPYGEVRDPWAPPSMEDKLRMITGGETTRDYEEGRMVEVQVQRTDDYRVHVNVIGSVLKATIPKHYLKSIFVEDRDPTSMSIDSIVNRGDTLFARVMKLNYDDMRGFELELACRSDILNDWNKYEQKYNVAQRGPYDTCYEFRPREAELAEIEHIKKEEARALLGGIAGQTKAMMKQRRKLSRAFVHRPIAHPLFKNVSHGDAMKALEEKKPGTAIIRPSVRTTEKLSVTLKICDGIFASHEIIEKGKQSDEDGRDPRIAPTSLALGIPLEVEEARPGKDAKAKEKSEFEDLDELVATWLEPWTANLLSVIKDPKFYKQTNPDASKEERDAGTRIIALTPEDVQYKLKEKKAANASKSYIAWGLCCIPDQPGSFYLMHLHNKTCMQETIRVTSRGFLFQGTIYASLKKTILAFQSNYMKKMDDRRRMATMHGQPGGGGGGAPMPVYQQQHHHHAPQSPWHQGGGGGGGPSYPPAPPMPGGPAPGGYPGPPPMHAYGGGGGGPPPPQYYDRRGPPPPHGGRY